MVLGYLCFFFSSSSFFLKKILGEIVDSRRLSEERGEERERKEKKTPSIVLNLQCLDLITFQSIRVQAYPNFRGNNPSAPLFLTPPPCSSTFDRFAEFSAHSLDCSMALAPSAEQIYTRPWDTDKCKCVLPIRLDPPASIWRVPERGRKVSLDSSLDISFHAQFNRLGAKVSIHRMHLSIDESIDLYVCLRLCLPVAADWGCNMPSTLVSPSSLAPHVDRISKTIFGNHRHHFSHLLFSCYWAWRVKSKAHGFKHPSKERQQSREVYVFCFVGGIKAKRGWMDE